MYDVQISYNMFIYIVKEQRSISKHRMLIPTNKINTTTNVGTKTLY